MIIARKKWVCNSNSPYCKKVQGECAWDTFIVLKISRINSDNLESGYTLIVSMLNRNILFMPHPLKQILSA